MAAYDGEDLTVGTAIGLLLFAIGDFVLLYSKGSQSSGAAWGGAVAVLGLVVLWASRRRRV